MANYDLGPLWKQLRTDMLADSGLTDLLASAESIYRGWPTSIVASPFLAFNVLQANPDSRTIVGKWRPLIEIGLFATSNYTLDTIAGYLETNWSIPARRTTQVETASLRLTELVMFDATDAGRVRFTDSQEWIRKRATSWNARVILK